MPIWTYRRRQRIAPGSPDTARRVILEPSGRGLPETSIGADSPVARDFPAAIAFKDQLISTGSPFRRAVSADMVRGSAWTFIGKESMVSSPGLSAMMDSSVGSRMAV